MKILKQNMMNRECSFNLGQFRESYNTNLTLMGRGLRRHDLTGLTFFTGYEYGVLYDWDQYFEGILQLYSGWSTELLRNTVRCFLAQQEDSGFINRAYPCKFNWGHVKPFLAQIALLCKHVDGHLNWLNDELYKCMKKYIDYWLQNQDVRKSGLSVWWSAGHSGMDNQHERAGHEGDMYCEGVDANSYLVRECQGFSLVAKILGRDLDAAFYQKIAEERIEKIREINWDNRDLFFYDTDARTGEKIRVKSVSAFSALWSNVATPEQARSMVYEHLQNEKEFSRLYPVPGLSADEPGYTAGFIKGDISGCCNWRAHTWIPTNYQVIRGLWNYGYRDEARGLALCTYKMFCNDPFHEYYDTEKGTGTGLNPFWGWSSLAIFIPLELDLQIDPTALIIENDAVPKMRCHIRAITDA